MVVKLLEPPAGSLDNAQSDGRGISVVRSAFFGQHTHFSSYAYPPFSIISLLKQHLLRSLSMRQRYALRDVHTLAFILEPRNIDRPEQPETAELAKGLYLVQRIAASHNFNKALAFHNCTKEENLNANYDTKTVDNIMEEYTSSKTNSGGSLVLASVCNNDTMKEPLLWWQLWGIDHPHLQAVSVKVMKMPVGLAACERSFSNAATMQSKEKLHNLL